MSQAIQCFGQRLKEIRQQKGIERRDFAARVGIKESYLEKIERGYSPPPAAVTIRAFARVLHIDADELFCLAAKVPPDIERDLICSPLLVQVLRAISQWDADQLYAFLHAQGVPDEKLKYQAAKSRWEICDERRPAREPISVEMKKAIFRLDHSECVYCSAQTFLEVDHIFPHSQGGTDEPDNLVTCCTRCNAKKRGRIVSFPMVFGRFRAELEN